MIDVIAEDGIVIAQERKISCIRRMFKEDNPLARPTPKTAPTMAWVVEIGNPILEATKIVVAAANSAQKPLVGVR